MPLTVTVNSFSYKKSGIPIDNTGNGGGFVFDCRFIQNPGREDRFKKRTGLQDDVKEYLLAQESMTNFLKNVYSIIDPAIENYIERNFLSLMINFGCTGGQHRSVYSAEETAKHIRENFSNVEVKVRHIELENLKF